MQKTVDECLSGEFLFGDDFSPKEIEEWFLAEQEGYSSLGAADHANYKYQYHALNTYHGYNKLPCTKFEHVLGLGSAWGDELLPLVGRAERVTILDPSLTFSDTTIKGLHVDYRQPSILGDIDMLDASFDLVVCFGVLHHIPNVSHVIKEISRVLKPGGKFLLREPIVTMGDWRKKRTGLTKNERGIPLHIIRRYLLESGFVIESEAVVDFSPLKIIFSKIIRSDVFNSYILVKIDSIVSEMMRWNTRYHALSFWHKFRPTSAFFVSMKSDK